MPHHRLLGTNLEVSALCLGASGFGTDVQGPQADRLAAAFLEAGGCFFDTAHVYAAWAPGGVGASERELGAVLHRLGAWGQVVVATKGGHPSFGEEYRRPEDFLSERVIASDITESLERLGIGCIDLYYLHRDDGRTPVEDIIETLNREIQRGRLRYLGASNWSVPRIAAANEYARQQGLQGFVASQVQWSLATPTWQAGPDPTGRYVTDEEFAWHTGSQLPVVAYSATANGYFAGSSQGIALHQNAPNETRRERAARLARRLGCTPTQVALAWLMHQPFPVIPLFSTTKEEHLTEAMGALQVSLTPEETRWLCHGGSEEPFPAASAGSA